MKLSESRYRILPFNRPLNLLIVVSIILISACGPAGQTAISDPGGASESAAYLQPDTYSYTVFLVGDAGDAVLDPLTPSLQVLKEELESVGNGRGAVIFLGDNIYPDGLYPDGSPQRAENEEAILAQIESVRNFSGEVFFVPGNHDWQSSGEQGLEFVKRQESFVEDQMQRGNVFLPDEGYPGPVAITLQHKNDMPGQDYSIGLVVMDTHWWLHPHEKPLPFGTSNEQAAKETVMELLAGELEQFKNDEVVFTVHHPLYSYGRHGSKFPLKTHLVPPVFGSIYALYRNIWGYPQDIAHKNYSRMKEEILNAASENQHLIYASGHEHGLQFIPVAEDGKLHYQIVSGAATRSSYLRKKEGPVYTYETKGFAVVRYYPDRSKRVEFITDAGEKIFSRILAPK